VPNAQLYDAIGANYGLTRRTDQRIAAQIWGALGDARTVVNVGAGSGSYEPQDRHVLAVEPSAVMRSQRPPGAARCVAAAAERLPFPDHVFDAAMAVATVHHWPDPAAGLRELKRVARRVVVFTFDLDALSLFWLTRDYLPELSEMLADKPSAVEQAEVLGAQIEPVMIPWDCVDGFPEAYWRRPEAYLDDNIRRGMSIWAKLGPAIEQRFIRSLRGDLESGAWAIRNHDLIGRDAADLGLRLLIASGG